MKKIDGLTIASVLLMIAGGAVQLGTALVANKKQEQEIAKAVAEYKAKH